MRIFKVDTENSYTRLENKAKNGGINSDFVRRTFGIDINNLTKKPRIWGVLSDLLFGATVIGVILTILL